MKIFLSALEQRTANEIEDIIKHCSPLDYNLFSYFYIRKNGVLSKALRIQEHSKEILIDSGAHTFQSGFKEDLVKYTKEYAEFIKSFDNPKVVGYFEMDVDNIVGYDKVLELRKILTDVSDKIIPVWHKNRGVEEFKKMCREYKGKVIAISGGKHDIDNSQFLMFLKYAKKYNCKMHALGMTNQKILSQVPFDYTDSSSWAQKLVYGWKTDFVNGKLCNIEKVSRKFANTNRAKMTLLNYSSYQKMQKYYYEKWKKECKD